MRSFRDGFSRPKKIKNIIQPIPRSFANGFSRPVMASGNKVRYYSLGNEFTVRTGGYSVTYTLRGTVTLTKNADNMVITALESNDGYGGCCNGIAIDVTDIDTLYIDWLATIPSTNDFVRFGLDDSISDNAFLTNIEKTASFSRQVSSVNVSGISGTKYIKILVGNSTSASSGNDVITIYRISGEKAA